MSWKKEIALPYSVTIKKIHMYEKINIYSKNTLTKPGQEQEHPAMLPAQ